MSLVYALLVCCRSAQLHSIATLHTRLSTAPWRCVIILAQGAGWQGRDRRDRKFAVGEVCCRQKGEPIIFHGLEYLVHIIYSNESCAVQYHRS